jgi:hypothetical protein
MLLSLLMDKRDEDLLSRVGEASLPSDQSKLVTTTATFLQKSLTLSSMLFQSSSQGKMKPQRRPFRNLPNHHVIGLQEEKRIEESLPLVLRPVPLLDKCKNEIKMYHRWLGVYFRYSPSYSRPLRVLSLWINIVTLLFIQSVLYNMSDPDDGSCEKQETMDDCLRLKSSLSKSSRCVWEQQSGHQDQCAFRAIDHDFNRVLIIAMLSGILSSPFSVFFQSLILFVLSAETQPQERNERSEGQSLSFRWKKDRVCQDILSRTLQQDFGLLLQKVRLYRDVLLPEEKEEFECKFSSPLDLSRDTDPPTLL